MRSCSATAHKTAIKTRADEAADLFAQITELREVCGTVTGMFMVLGLAMGNSDAKDGSTKKNVYKSVQELASKFKEDNGSIICRELLGLQKANKESYVPSERTTEYYKKRPCPELCKYAADILEEYLKEEDLI